MPFTAKAWRVEAALPLVLWHMQAMRKHRRSVIEPGQSGRFGRLCLTYLVLFQVLLPSWRCRH
jgi:hypothetical protein